MNISGEKRKYLENLINSRKEFEEKIEVNIFQPPFSEQRQYDHRIRRDAQFNVITGGGKALSPEELINGYKTAKICYCWNKSDFNDTIVTIFHELNHFNDPFDIGELNRIKMKKLELNLLKNLEYNVYNLYNEYFAEYKTTVLLADFDQFIHAFRKSLLKEAKVKLRLLGIFRFSFLVLVWSGIIFFTLYILCLNTKTVSENILFSFLISYFISIFLNFMSFIIPKGNEAVIINKSHEFSKLIFSRKKTLTQNEIFRNRINIFFHFFIVMGT